MWSVFSCGYYKMFHKANVVFYSEKENIKNDISYFGCIL
ncbi:Hypothetical protein Ccan_10740 [Capnocytophaga canimorsus Cc5]|uniref:Uncharacterized protein n=1 Tax=Capnocytophaga canimorsus (strain 5) TaxID=860228 RepID=F9YVM6_CAPCC|nr:Hypothetical protein Ccan_10740 [Capnocytophaga canimorsus Cc5]